MTALTVSSNNTPATTTAALTDDARMFASASLAASTRRAYSRAFARFAAWCGDRATAPLTGNASLVANYLADMAAGGKTPPTIGQAYAAIRAAHDWAGVALTETAEIRRVRAGIRRVAADNGVAPVQARAVTTAEVRAMADAACTVLDRALVLVGFAGGFRRSELTGFTWADLELTERLAVITLRRSKTDQTGEGQTVVIDATGSRHCPVQALHDLAGAGDTAPGDRVFPRDGRSVSRTLKRLARRAGVGLDRLSGHSLRAGIITALAENDAPVPLIAAHVRHRDINTTLGYVRPVDARKSTLVQQAGL